MLRRTLPLLLALVAALALAAVAAGQGRDRPSAYVLPGDAVFPEGIATGPGGAFYVSSTTDGTIFRGDVREAQAGVLSPGGADGRTTAVGLRTDRSGRRLFVAGGATGRAWVLSTAPAARSPRWTPACARGRSSTTWP